MNRKGKEEGGEGQREEKRGGRDEFLLSPLKNSPKHFLFGEINLRVNPLYLLSFFSIVRDNSVLILWLF